MEIRDPVHGFVHLSDAERKILDSECFQRLRNIRQLGMSYYVYPSAVHTRFEHSIGTLYVATQIFEVLVRKHGKYFEKLLGIKGDEANLIKRLRITLRLAALLHDIGHPPFSHATEELFPKNRTHEELGVEVIKEKLERVFKQREIKRSGVNLEDVVFLIYPENVEEISQEDASALYLLREIISGEIDADRIDYLTRDSHHTGVIYGKFDYMRLIDTITIVPHVAGKSKTFQEFDIPQQPEPRIGVEFGGLHTVEGLILARYFMFLQVYFHHVRRIYDLMLTDFLKFTLPDGCYPADVDEYLEYDDIKVLNSIRDVATGRDSYCKEAKTLAERLYTRKHPKRILESNRLPLKIDEFEEEIKNKLQKNFDHLDPYTDIYVDDPRKATTKLTEAEFYVIEDSISENLVDYWKFEEIGKLKRKGKIAHIADKSELIKKLPTIGLIRVYVNLKTKKDIEEAEKICRKFYTDWVEEEGGKNG